jgi:hypothetical protein
MGFRIYSKRLVLIAANNSCGMIARTIVSDGVMRDTMPTFRKLTSEEVNRVKGLGPRKQLELEYDAYLAEFGPGDSGEAQLGDGEKRMTVMNRLKAAAKRREPPLKIVFRRTTDDTLMRFRISLEVPQIAVTLNKPAARGGKLKKQ